MEAVELIRRRALEADGLVVSFAVEFDVNAISHHRAPQPDGSAPGSTSDVVATMARR